MDLGCVKEKRQPRRRLEMLMPGALNAVMLPHMRESDSVFIDCRKLDARRNDETHKKSKISALFLATHVAGEQCEWYCNQKCSGTIIQTVPLDCTRTEKGALTEMNRGRCSVQLQFSPCWSTQPQVLYSPTEMNKSVILPLYHFCLVQ
jgi:hypothetical protein